MSALYLLAGINHFWKPKVYLRIMPPWLPAHPALVTISGVAEILLALLLLPAQTRVFASWGIIVLLIAIFPANVQMMLNYYHKQDPSLWITILRLPLQAVLIWWALVYTR